MDGHPIVKVLLLLSLNHLDKFSQYRKIAIPKIINIFYPKTTQMFYGNLTQNILTPFGRSRKYNMCRISKSTNRFPKTNTEFLICLDPKISQIPKMYWSFLKTNCTDGRILSHQSFFPSKILGCFHFGMIFLMFHFIFKCLISKVRPKSLPLFNVGMIYTIWSP